MVAGSVRARDPRHIGVLGVLGVLGVVAGGEDAAGHGRREGEEERCGPLARGRQPDVAAATELVPNYHVDPDLEVGVVHPGALLAVLGPALRRERAAAGRAVQGHLHGMQCC